VHETAMVYGELAPPAGSGCPLLAGVLQVPAHFIR